MKHISFIALGSNLGNRSKNISKAVNLILKHPNIAVEKISNLYETSPVGGPKQGLFLNGVLKIKTSLSAEELLEVILMIEKKCGRERRIKWGPRTLDLDILSFGKQVISNSQLTIPHPHYQERKFVLIPWIQIDPRFKHPILKKKNVELLLQLTAVDQRVTIHSSWRKSQFYPFKKRKKKNHPSSR